MQKKNIAFLLKYKFTDTEFLNLNLSNLYKNFNVKFIDISKIIYGKEIHKLELKIKKKKLIYHKIKTTTAFKSILSDADYVLDYNGAIPQSKKVSNFFNKENFHKFKLIGILWGIQPNFFNFNISQKIFFIFIFFYNVLKYRKFLFIINKLVNFFTIYFHKLKKKYKNYNFFYDYVLISSDTNEQKITSYFNKSKKIYGHYKDYERHLLRSYNKQYKKNFAVFLDESLFDHPDVCELNLNNILNSKKNKKTYYKNLNNFFDNFERVTNNEVIIALHPRSLISNKDCNKYFFNRRVIRNNCYELVKKSKLVFAHATTSVAYAVILKKPIVFLNSKLMFDVGHFTKILSFSMETGRKMIDINNENINYNNLFDQNFLFYKNYLNKFIKSSKSKNKSLWNIIRTEVNN